MVSFMPQFKHKYNQKLHLIEQKVAGCCMYHVTSSAVSRDIAVKLTTDSYPILDCTLNSASNFSIFSIKQFARKNVLKVVF